MKTKHVEPITQEGMKSVHLSTQGDRVFISSNKSAYQQVEIVAPSGSPIIELEAFARRLVSRHEDQADLFNALRGLSAITESIVSDWASFSAEVSLPEKDRRTREQFYSHELAKALDSLGEATELAQSVLSSVEAHR